MAKHNCKFMTEAQVAEINKLLEGEHGDTIRACMLESVNAYSEGFCEGIADGCVKNFVKGSIIGGVTVAVGYALFDIGLQVYHKLKEEKKPTEKPGRVWEA